MSAQKLLYVFTQAPYSHAAGQEALDAALIGASFEQSCSLLFLHDGVFQLKAGQNTGQTSLKQVSKTFGALADFGIENIYIDELSMLARGVSIDELIVEAESLNRDAIGALLAEQFRVFTF